MWGKSFEHILTPAKVGWVKVKDIQERKVYEASVKT
jgi:hypothetical protein